MQIRSVLLLLLTWHLTLPLWAAAKDGRLIISLNSGIRGYVVIGDREDSVISRCPWEAKKTVIPKSSMLASLRFTTLIFYPQIGTRIYFRNGKVGLIEIQDPFQGEIQGKKLRVFRMSAAAPGKWADVLIQEFGIPQAQVAGGVMNSEGLFYKWGDMSFNASGPNEIAIYRDPQLLKFRQKNFGRKLELFKP